jgi:hypothetical protein
VIGHGWSASLRLVAGACLAAVVVGVAGGAELGAAEDDARPVPGAVGAALRDAVPGMYVTDDVATRVEPSGAVTLLTDRPCEVLTEMMLAGDWHRTQRLDVPADVAPMLAIAGLRPMSLLRQGTAHALLTTDDRDGGCRATVAVAPDGAVSIDAGVASVDAGWAHAIRCVTSESTLFVSLVVGGDGLSGVMQVVVDGDGAQRGARLDDSSDSMLSVGPNGVLDALGAALAAELAGSGAGTAPVAVVDGTSSSGSAVIDADAPLPRGTIEMTGGTWFDDATGASGPLDLRVPFACPSVTSVP